MKSVNGSSHVVFQWFFTSKKDKKTSHLTAKLQMRYCGPYRITKIINPVLYEADIHNTIKRVHAVNMKPA